MNCSQPPANLPTCAAVQRSGSRGFTLLELLTVVTIIGVFCALALPSMATRMRDRRTTVAANQITMLYRTARMRAIGRGSAVLVRYDKTGTQTLVVREAIAGSNATYGCNLQPVSSCTVPFNRWDSVNLYSQIDLIVPFPANKSFEHTQVDLSDGAGVVQGQYDVCFSPSGVTYGRSAFGAAFGVLNNIPSLRLCTKEVPSATPCVSDANNKLGVDRYVYVLPNGIARLAI